MTEKITLLLLLLSLLLSSLLLSGCKADLPDETAAGTESRADAYGVRFGGTFEVKK